jgi:acyl-coenzyme A thioesterase PaaI-like protein
MTLLKKQPNSKHCFACGLENNYGLKLTFYSEGEDMVVCTYKVPEHYQGYPGVVHGGVITSIMDEVLVRAFMAQDPNRFMFTAKLTIRFRQNVPTQQPLKIIGKITKDRGRMAESKAELFGPNGKLLAEAEGLLVALPEDEMPVIDIDALGWQVYPDKEVER